MSAFRRHHSADRVTDNAFVPLFDRIAPRETGVRDQNASMLSDVRDLLNTRLTEFDPDQVRPSLASSLLCYGVRDSSCIHLYPSDEEEHRSLANAIQRALRTFEPRLTGVQVEHRLNAISRTFVFHVTCRAHHSSTPIDLDASLDPSTNRFRVDRTSSGGQR